MFVKSEFFAQQVAEKLAAASVLGLPQTVEIGLLVCGDQEYEAEVRLTVSSALRPVVADLNAAIGQVLAYRLVGYVKPGREHP